MIHQRNASIIFDLVFLKDGSTRYIRYTGKVYKRTRPIQYTGTQHMTLWCLCYTDAYGVVAVPPENTESHGCKLPTGVYCYTYRNTLSYKVP